MSLVEKLFGSFSDRELKKVNPITKQVLALEPKYQAMSDADLQAQTAMFKQQLPRAKRWTTFCRMPLPSAARLHGACWA